MIKLSIQVTICGLMLPIFMFGVSYAETASYGIGLKSCGQYVRVYDYVHKTSKDAPATIETAEFVTFLSWTLGFTTAVSFYTKYDYLSNQDEYSTTLWLANYCRKHPLEKYIEANLKLLNKLRGQ